MILEDQIIFSHIFRFLCEFVVVGNPEWREIVHYFKTFLRGNKLDIDISRMMDNINDILTINSIYNLPPEVKEDKEQLDKKLEEMLQEELADEMEVDDDEEE